jgi:hypothetical protein
MMVPKKSLILAGAALALLGASSSAQSQSGKVFARYNKPLRSVALDLETGTITKSPPVQDKKVATVATFQNADLGGFVGVDTGNKFCEWFDNGTKGTAGSELMRSILFAYCSANADTGSGGPGGSVRLGFYEGYTVGGGAPTTAVAVFTLTGLPGNTASSSFFGGFRCYFIRVTFNPTVNFESGPIAYSWHFMDVGRDGVLAGTWPFLSCVQSCSGTGLPNGDGQGMTDTIDEYCPSGQFPPRATFSFGTTSVGSYFTSISMQIEELLPNSCLVAQNAGDNNCNVCNWIGVVNQPAGPVGGQLKATTPGSSPQAACLGGVWQPRVQLNAKGAHTDPTPPAPNNGIHGASGVCKYRIYIGTDTLCNPTNGPCPNVLFSDAGPPPLFAYNVKVELGFTAQCLLGLDIPGTVAAGVTNIAPQTVPKDVSFACIKWICYANIQTAPGPVKCRSKTLFGVVGVQ